MLILRISKKIEKEKYQAIDYASENLQRFITPIDILF